MAFAPIVAMTQLELALTLPKPRKVRASEREAQAWFEYIRRKIQGGK